MRFSIIPLLYSLIILAPIRSCSSHLVEDSKQVLDVHNNQENPAVSLEDRHSIKSVKPQIKKDETKEFVPIFTEAESNTNQLELSTSEINVDKRQEEEGEKNEADIVVVNALIQEVFVEDVFNVDKTILVQSTQSVANVVTEETPVQLVTVNNKNQPIFPKILQTASLQSSEQTVPIQRNPVALVKHLPLKPEKSIQEKVKDLKTFFINIINGELNLYDVYFKKHKRDFENNNPVRIKVTDWINRIQSKSQNTVEKCSNMMKKYFFKHHGSNSELEEIIKSLRDKQDVIRVNLDNLRFLDDDIENFEQTEERLLDEETFKATEILKEDFKKAVQILLEETKKYELFKQ